jgi:AcrR family transcriptional regulator
MVASSSQPVATRPAGRPRGDRDKLILEALERLLETTPLRDLNVEEIAEESGITRTRFYRYHKSKNEAFAALLHRISGSSLSQVSAPGNWLERPSGARPRDALRPTLHRAISAALTRRAVLREASDLWNSVPEVRDSLYRVISRLAQATAATIERERLAGTAPPGPDALRLAYSLLWQSERLLFLKAIELPEAMPADELTDILLEIWMRTIYCADDPDPTPPA